MNVENNIPDNWIEPTLGEVVEIKYGKDHKKLDDGDIPCFGSGGLMRLVNAELYNKPSVLIPRKGTLSNLFFFDKPFWTVDTLFYTIINEERVIPKYLYYKLKTLNLEGLNVGSAVPSLTTEVLNQLQICIPNIISEQKAIANVLTAFDDKIELLQQQNTTLETLAQTIFKEWFGKYQLGDELPEGWRVGKINEFIKSSLGGDYGMEEITGDFNQETICLRGTDLPDMKTGTPEKAPVRYLKDSKLEKCKLENGDIVIEISGGTENQSTGRVMYINDEILENAHLPMTCVNFCRILRPAETQYSYFIYSLFDYLYNRKVMFNWENGTTGIKNLNLKALLEGFNLVMPKSTEKIIEFNKLVKSSFIKIQTNNKQIQSLTKTRDTLLPNLMSGQVRVKM